MHKSGQSIKLSASDLSGHLNCRYLTELDLAVANGELEKPHVYDPSLDILVERGRRHEQAYVDHLQAAGKSVVVIEGVGATAAGVEETVAAMAAGADVIVQGALADGDWGGRSDILSRVEKPSTLGGWSYEVADTKLARQTKGGSVLQLVLYSDLVSTIQGVAPERSYIVIPGTDFVPEEYRIDDFAAYYRRVKKSLVQAVSGQNVTGNYPDPKEHCDICRWRRRCDAKRHADDHLCLVAGISKVQINELKGHEIATLTALAGMPLPLSWKPKRGALASYERIREQARIQSETRAAGRLLHEFLPIEPKLGLSALPAPSLGDIFFDLEGDPFVEGGGMEFLFGYSYRDDNGAECYTADWVTTRDEEKAAFERFVDFAVERINRHPETHIYHYAPYEAGALKRLMGRYATREDEIDTMLRAHRFVDLYRVVRNGLRAGVESYSIKRLEPLYDFNRETQLDDAGAALVRVEACLELNDTPSITDADRAIVEGYNRDDCISNWRLRDWLEESRSGLIDRGAQIERPVAEDGQASENVTARQERVNALIEALTAGVPVNALERTAEQQALWLLAYILDWHRREAKSTHWERFRLAELSDDELFDEGAGLSGLQFQGRTGGTDRCPIHRYSFTAQDTDLREDDEATIYAQGGSVFGALEKISVEGLWIDIKKRTDSADIHPQSVFAHSFVQTTELADSLVRLGEYVAEHGIVGEGDYQAARDLLMREKPRMGDVPLRLDGEDPVNSACRLALHLNAGVLPIQGPPGSGKTYTAARMICELVKAGKTVGVTAISHKVIRKLLDGVIEASAEAGMDIHCIQKPRDKADNLPCLTFVTKNADVFAALSQGCHVAGGTAWLWAGQNAIDAVDVLFVDEAAQMSLANVLAVSQAAKCVVLVGDPQQLQQPSKGSHPEGTQVSALDHILGDAKTIADDRGLFLGETWRLHPDICAFTSELFYERRLQAQPDNEVQTVKSAGSIKGTGLRYRPVIHDGNQNSSLEEVQAVASLVTEIISSHTSFVDRKGVERLVSSNDILVISPYNAQVYELKDRLPAGIAVGTVDKFQGQEAPIVIYSMATSSSADAPRGMEFLYSLNRLNVATSRARCLCILVANPAVFEADCRTPRHMKLANAFARYLELATVV